MTSGDTLFQFFPQDNEPPVSINGLGYATFDTRNSVMPQPCLDFDVTIPEYAKFTGILPNNYSSGGFTATIIWAATSAATGAVVWGFAFDRMNSGFDISASPPTFSTTITTTVSANSSGALIYTSVAFTDGAQIDSIAKGEMFKFLIGRLATDAGDTMLDDAELYGINVRET